MSSPIRSTICRSARTTCKKVLVFPKLSFSAVSYDDSKLGVQGNYNRFQNRRIGITGAYGGFAREISDQIVLEGGTVIGLGRNETELSKLKEKYGAHFESVPCDVSDEKGQTAAVDGLIKYSADSLVNNAGIFRESLFLDLSRKDYKDILATNLEATTFISQGISKHWAEINKEIKAKGGGDDKLNPYSIVHISSMAGILPLQGHSAYGISKAAIDYLTKQMALELTQYGIQVNSVNPTIIDSEMGTGERGYWGNIERKTWALQRIPMNRFGNVKEVTSLVCYLLSNEARFICGQLLQLDGGFVCTGSNIQMYNL